MRPLTQLQQRCLVYLRRRALKGLPPPTLREVSAAVGLRSNNSWYPLDALRRRGYLVHERGKVRTITLADDFNRVRSRDARFRFLAVSRCPWCSDRTFVGARCPRCGRDA